MIVNTLSAPIIDGASDAAWTKAPKNLIAQTISGTIQTGSTWQAMYDTTNLYVLVQVKDANLSSMGNATGYDQDGVEIMISGNNSKSGAYTSSDHQYRFNWNVFPYSVANIIGATTNSKVGIVYAIPATTGGYTLEVAIPWTTIGGTTPAPFNGKEIGFDININDQQNGAGPREATAGWNGTNNDDYTNTAGFGTATVTICNGDTVLVAPVISSIITARDTANTPFSFTVLAANSPTSFAAVNLPAGLTINSSTGIISGIPTSYGVFAAMVSATNAAGTGNATLTITIDSLPGITSSVTAAGKVGTAFDYTVTASHIPTSYGAALLPEGVIINTVSGLISGTPITSGIYAATISATNSIGTSTTGLTITIDTATAVNFESINAVRQNAKVNVQWSVSNERFVQQYEIQSSIDSINFTTISTITQLGNTSYTGFDLAPSGGYIFYRIKAVSTDSNSPAFYSAIAKVDKIYTSMSFASINATRQNTGINVQWTVDSENFVQEYVVQRSTDSINFITIGTITQIGNTGLNNIAYNSVDASPAAGNNFYRVIAVIIANYSASDTSHIAKVDKIIAATIYPNPIKSGGIASLHLINQMANTYSIRLLNYVGKLMPLTQSTINVDAGDIIYPLPLSANLIAGYYYLELYSASTGKIMLKLVVE
jgi:hypothetical protein